MVECVLCLLAEHAWDHGVGEARERGAHQGWGEARWEDAVRGRDARRAWTRGAWAGGWVLTTRGSSVLRAVYWRTHSQLESEACVNTVYEIVDTSRPFRSDTKPRPLLVFQGLVLGKSRKFSTSARAGGRAASS